MLPSGTSLHELEVLGPVDARKWDLTARRDSRTRSRRGVVLPDGTHFIELSFKVAADEAQAAERAFHALLDHLKIGHDGDPDRRLPRSSGLRRAIAVGPIVAAREETYATIASA